MSDNKKDYINVNTVENYNNALSTNWIVIFHNLPNVQYFVQSINLPSISVDTIPVPYMNQTAKIPDNKINFGDLSMTFIIDEDFVNYDALMAELFTQEDSNVNVKYNNKVFHDITVTRMSSNNVPIARWHLEACSLNMLGAVNYDSTQSEPALIVCDASFSVTRMSVEHMRKSKSIQTP